MNNDITGVVGMDVSDRYSHLCVLGLDGEVEEESKVPTTSQGIRRRFSEMDRVRVALAGGHSFSVDGEVAERTWSRSDPCQSQEGA